MQSIYEQYQLKNVINASGRMTMLGVSTPKAEVTERVGYGLNHYFEIKDLVNKTGQYIAKLLKVENAVVVSCASAGITQSVAAVIVKDNADLLYNLHTSPQPVAREIVMPKGHNVNYGAPVDTMVALGGGEIVEAGYANECSAAQIAAKITDQTAAILYVKSHHCVQKSMLTVKEAAQVAKKHQIPLLVDAAAEEDLVTYYQDGADLVIYSGAKAIEGPTSGLVIGKHQYVEWVKQQSSGIGRAMKVGKEGILGLTLAIELYLTTKKETGEQMVERMSDFIDDLNKINSVKAQIVWDTAGRDIARAEISFDQKAIGKTTYAMMAELKQGDTAIYFREYKANEGKVEADIRSVTNEQLKTIVSRIRQVVTGVK